MTTIIVGVDGSAGSIEALQWAVQEAELRGAKVRAISVWDFPYAYGGLTATVPLPTEGLEDATRASLETAIVAAVPDAAKAAAIERAVMSGNPSNVLVDESAHADMLVVGARGHGGFLGLLLGSTSDQIVKHAACPVVVVRSRTSA